MSEHPQDLSLREQARAIASGELDATELLEVTLARIEERDGRVNSIVDRFASESAGMLAEAPEGPLHGVPVAIKDLYALPWRAPRDGAMKTIYGVGPGESGVFRRLRDAGAVIVGVTNMHEFGIGSTGHISAYGPCATPWDSSRCAGGSSGGSGAAVAARLVAGAVGSDGGGSIRYPASYCGITGLKCTWGRISSEGYSHGSASMGASGPMCRDAADTRLLAEVLVGEAMPTKRTEGLRVGAPALQWRDLDPEVERACREAVEALGDAGLEICEVDLPGSEHALIATVLRLGAELIPSSKKDALAEIESALSPVTRALGKYQYLIPSPALVMADRVRAQIRRSLADAFEGVDALAWPTAPAPAPPIENPRVELPSGELPADFANVRLGGIANLAGVPAISTPCGFTSQGLPVGLQMLAPWGEDARLLDLAQTLEQANARRYVDALPPIAQAAVA